MATTTSRATLEGGELGWIRHTAGDDLLAQAEGAADGLEGIGDLEGENRAWGPERGARGRSGRRNRRSGGRKHRQAESRVLGARAARPSTSRPASASGMVACWIGERVVNPLCARVLAIASGR